MAIEAINDSKVSRHYVSQCFTRMGELSDNVNVWHFKQQRWRDLATSGTFTHPYKRATFVPKKEKPVVTQKPTSPAKPTPHMERPKLAKALQKLTIDQKSDVVAYTSGHLNHDRMNKEIGRIQNMGKKIEFKSSEQEYTLDETVKEMERFDAVRQGQKVGASNHPAPVTNLKTSHINNNCKFVPNYQLKLSKRDKLKSFVEIDKGIVSRERLYTKSLQAGNQDKVEAYQKLVQENLSKLNCAQDGPSIERLQVYSAVFAKLMTEFKSFEPILAEIKHEYDTTISSFQADQRELIFLRTKVQKLLGENENRLLLTFEQEKNAKLNEIVHNLQGKIS
jgi:hypothetical protein